jgi:hypothetical protein
VGKRVGFDIVQIAKCAFKFKCPSLVVLKNYDPDYSKKTRTLETYFYLKFADSSNT